jgi:hypothetical protein
MSTISFAVSTFPLCDTLMTSEIFVALVSMQSKSDMPCLSIYSPCIDCPLNHLRALSNTSPKFLRKSGLIRRLTKWTELLNAVSEQFGGYSFEEPGEDDEELLGQAEQESFIELFEHCVKRPPLRLGLARHLERSASK